MTDPIEPARKATPRENLLYGLRLHFGGDWSINVDGTIDAYDAAVRAAAIAETEARYRGLVEAAQRVGDWFHLAQEAYSTKYGFSADGDLEAEEVINFDDLAAALRAIEVAETTSVTEVIEGDTNG